MIHVDNGRVDEIVDSAGRADHNRGSVPLAVLHLLVARLASVQTDHLEQVEIVHHLLGLNGELAGGRQNQHCGATRALCRRIGLELA